MLIHLLVAITRVVRGPNNINFYSNWLYFCGMIFIFECTTILKVAINCFVYVNDPVAIIDILGSL